MKDYLIDVRVKNNRLMKRILDAGFESVPDFCRKTGFNSATVYQCLRLKQSVYDKKFNLRSFPKRLAEYFLCEPTDLFPEEVWYEELKQNSVKFEASSHEIQSITNQARSGIDGLEHLIDMEKAGTDLMRCFGKNENADVRTLKSRKQMADVIRMRFYEDMKLHEIGKIMGVSIDRVRQIEQKALRIMRHPDRSEKWREAL